MPTAKAASLWQDIVAQPSAAAEKRSLATEFSYGGRMWEICAL